MNTLALDKEGYLRNLSDWSRAVAERLAAAEAITLTEKHWELIELVRGFYDTFEVSPEMRVLVKHARNQLGQNKGNSIYLMQLFGESPAKTLAKVAGLPRPTNCL
jgi:tRNA 2-thiouridine synthesizing protein E